MNIPKYCDLDCSPNWFHGDISRYEAEEKLYSLARYIGQYSDRSFLIREKSPGSVYALSVYKYYTNMIDHYLINKTKNVFIINNVCINTCNLEHLVYYLSNDIQLCQQIDGEEDRLCKLICRYK